MNKENLQKGVDYLEANYYDINERFNMRYFRDKGLNDDSPICNSVGCLVGHLTAIDADNIIINYKFGYSPLDFQNWSKDFFGVGVYEKGWDFMFDSAWAIKTRTNTLRQGINRMKYMLKHGQPPEGWSYGDTYE